MNRVPIYNVRTWRIRSADGQRIVLRPTLKTFAIRLQATVLFFAIVGVIEFGTRSARYEAANRAPVFTEAEQEQFAAQAAAMQESMREEFGDEFMDRVEREVQQDRAERQVQRDAQEARNHEVRGWLNAGRYALYGLLGACGVLPPLSCLWSRVSIHKNVRGEVSVFALALLPRRRVWAGDHFERVRTYAMERFWFGRYNIITKHAWDWYIQLAPGGFARMPVTLTLAWAAGEDLPPQFLVFRQKYQPGTKERAPEPVREFVKAVRALTGLPADQPEIVEARVERGLLGTRVSRRMPAGSVQIPVSRETQTYASIDEMPPEVRDRFRELLETGEVTRRDDGGIEVVSRKTMTIDTPGGQVRPEDLDKLPPDVRRQVEELTRRSRGR